MIKPIAFGNAASAGTSYPQPWLTTKLVNRAHRLLTWDQRTEQFFDRLILQPKEGVGLNPLKRIYNGVVKTAKWFGVQATRWDYDAFPRIGRFKISEPPKGPLILLMLGVIIGYRVVRAIQRGRDNNDYREVGDVLRRDVTAISAFLFVLKPLVDKLNALMETRAGISLVDQSGRSFLYSELSDIYRISNQQKLMNLLKTNNAEGLLQAVKSLYYDTIPTKLQGPLSEPLQKLIPQLQDDVAELVAAYGKKIPEADLVKLCEKTMKTLTDMQAVRTNIFESLRETTGAKIVKKFEKKFPEYLDFLAHYAQKKRLPIDVMSFLSVCVLIGWLPIKFNQMWNEWQFHNDQKKKPPQLASNFDPQLTYANLKQSSRLAANFRG